MIATPCPHDKTPCPVCAGLDSYSPTLYECQVCSRMKKWDKDGKADNEGMAKSFLEKLIEAEKENKELRRCNKELRGKGMRDIGYSGSRNQSNAEKES